MIARTFLLLAAYLAWAGQTQQPAPADHDKVVKDRGDHVMGFSHEKTTHHFRLYSDGGAVEVTSNDANDVASRDQIRMHLTHIAKMFSEGDFSAPMLIHAQNPPGTAVMKRLRTEIKYLYQETPRGAAVRITSRSPQALKAIHDFLLFQIRDHHTGDLEKVTSPPSI